MPVVIDLAKVTSSPVDGTAVAGEEVDFDFTVTCSSTQSDCVNLTLTDSFPEPIVFDEVNANSNYTIAPAPNGFVLTFTNPLDEGGFGLVAGETVTFQAKGFVDSDVDASYDGVTVVNTAYATVDNPDSDTEASDDVAIIAPPSLTSTVSKATVPNPGVITGFPNTPLAFSLSATNTSNTSVDQLIIQDPPTPLLGGNVYQYLTATSLSGIQFPTGANRVLIDSWNGASWDLDSNSADTALPGGTIRGLRFTFFNSVPGVRIERDAQARVTVNTVTTADVADLTSPFTTTNYVSSQVIRDAALGTIAGADDDFTINPAAISPLATKTFDRNDVIGGEDVTAALTAQNDGDFVLSELSITEPETATTSLADQGLEFTGFATGLTDTEWPTGAVSAEVAFAYDDLLPSTTYTLDPVDPLPTADPGRTVTGFTVTFFGTMQPGELGKISFEAHTLPTLVDTVSTNTIRVDARTVAGLTDSDTASDDLVRRNTRIATTIDKFFSPSTLFASPGSPTLVSLTSQIDPLPSGPLDTGGSTVGATSFIVTDSALGSPFWSRFNATHIVATEIPVGATLEILYSVDDGVSYDSGDQLLAPTDGPDTITMAIPSGLQDSVNGIRFIYTPTNPGTLLPPGFNVQPNLKVELRSTLRGTGTPVIDPFPTPDLLLDNWADTFVENAIAAQSDTDQDDAVLTLRPLPPGGGPGYDLIEKHWIEDFVRARSGDTATATISWGTAGQEYSSVLISDGSMLPGDPSMAGVDDTVYDAFNLVGIPAITPAMDPYLFYDAVEAVEYFSRTTNQWEPLDDNSSGGACNVASDCYGTFPGYTLSTAEQEDAIGVRLVFIENPDRTFGGVTAPLIGAGVAATIDLDRDLNLTFQLRDTLRSNPATPVLGATREQLYNTGTFGEVDNTAGIEGRDVTDSVIWSEDDNDQIQIIDTAINVLTTKVWDDDPLGVPPIGTLQELFPQAHMTITATNASVVPVNELRLDEPSTFEDPLLGPNGFDYVDLVQISKLASSTDTTSMVTLKYDGGTYSAPMDIDDAVLLPPGDLDDVIGIRISGTGRVPSGTVIGLQLQTQLREFVRSAPAVRVAPMTVNNQVVASAIDPGGLTVPVAPETDNVVTAVASDTLDIEVWTYGVAATKAISTVNAEFDDTTSTSTTGTATVNPPTQVSGVPDEPAIQYDNEEATASQAVVTLTGRPTGNVRTTELIIEDSAPTFWNAFNFVSIGTTPLADARKRVQVDVLLGYQPSYGFGVEYATTPATISSSCTNDAVNDCWVLGSPSLTPTLPTMPGGAVAADIRGLRFTYTNADGSAWERPYNPTMTALFTVDRREYLVSPSTSLVPSTHFDYTDAAPGESEIGVFTNEVEVTGAAREVGSPPGDPARWQGTADAAAEIRYQHLPARVMIKKSPVGAQSLNTDIPYKIVVTNTGGAYDRGLGEIVVTDRLPVDDLVLPVAPQLVLPDDPDTGMPYDIGDLVSVRVADASNATQATPSFTADLLAVDGDHQDIVITFDDDWVLPKLWTITITIRLQFAPQLEAGTDVVNTATVVADQPFDSCEYYEDNAPDAEDPVFEVGECSSFTTIYPLASAPVTIVKGVRGVDAGPLDTSGVPIEESPGDPYDDLGILKTVPGSAVTCASPNVTVDIVAEYYRYPCVPITRPGGTEEWASTFTNGGNIGLTEIVAIDVLPAPNDRGVIVNEARGSKWTPTLTTYPTFFGLPTDAAVTVYYLTDRAIASQRCNGADIQATLGMTPSTDPPMTTGYQTCYTNSAPLDSVASRNAAWTVLSPAATPALLETVVAMKFVITMLEASPLEPGDKLSIVYQSTTAAVPEVAETGASVDNQSIAYNSIAAAAAGFDPTSGLVVPNRFVTEPRKVGVAMATGSVELRKTVTGGAASYAQTNFAIDLTCTSAGVVLPVRTESVPRNAALATIVHGLPLYASCAVSEASSYNQNPNTSSITPGTVVAQAPEGPGIETILDPNPVFSAARPDIELSTVTNDYPTTTFTITKTIDNNGALNGEGGSATAVYPNDLRFSAVCTFDNGNGTAQSVLNVANIPISNGGTYTSPAIPVGSSCTVTETATRGAQSTTRIITVGGVAGSSSASTSAVFTVDDSGNSVAFTNNYSVAELTVNKSVLGSWYTAVVGPGEDPHTVGPFTINVVCTRQLNTGAVDTTYTASFQADPYVVGGLTHTFENIIQGSTCTITESVTGGASTVAISGSGTVSNISGMANTRTVTNTFTNASLAVTKTVHSTAVDTDGDAVYVDAPYTALIACTFQGDPVYGTGFLPDPSGQMTLVFTAAELGNTRTSTETITGLPTGAACTVTESPVPASATDVITNWTAGDGPDGNSTPDSGTGAASVVVTPLIADGQATANTAVVNNYFGVGHFTVEKQLLGGDADDQFGTGPFTIHVVCESPIAVPTTTFDDVIVLTSSQLSETIDNLADGSVCSAEETNFSSTGADALVYVDGYGATDDGEDVDAMGADPRVVIQNWYYTGSVQVTKTVGGPGEPDYGTGPFTVTLTCVRDVSGTPVTATIPVPTRVMDPAIPASMVAIFTGLPNDAVCTLAETDALGVLANGGATASEITDGSTSTTDVETGFEFTVDADSPVTTALDIVQPALDLTNTFELASLTVTKNVSSSALDSAGDPVVYGPFPVSVSCTFGGSDVYGTGYDSSTPMAALLDHGVPWVIDGLPAGADCTVNEDSIMSAVGTTATVVEASGTPVTTTATFGDLTLGQTGLTNSATLTNFYDTGSLRVSKVVDGAGRDDWGTADFAVNILCELNDGSGLRTVRDIDHVFNLGDLDPVLLEDLPSGTVCAIEELTTGTATTVEIEVDTVSTLGTVATATIGNDAAPVEAVITNTFDYTQIEVTKVRTGAGYVLYGEGPFEVTLSCAFDGQAITVPGGSTRELSAANLYYNTYEDLPVGADCILDESESFGANTVTITDGASTAASDLAFTTTSANTLVTVTNDYEVGELTVDKASTGLGSFMYGDGSAIYGSAGYEVTLDCTRDVDGVATAVDFPGDPNQVLDGANGYTYTYTDLPVGAVCEVSETRKGFATESIVGAPMTITPGIVGTVSISVVNDFQLGTLALEKATLGLFAAHHEGEEFEVTVECWQDVDGTWTEVAPIADGETRPIRAGEVTEFVDLPVPAECTFEETQSGGADLAVYSVASLPMLGSTVTVEEGDLDMGLANLFTLAHSGADAEVWLIGALVTMLSGVALVIVGRRREKAAPRVG